MMSRFNIGLMAIGLLLASLLPTGPASAGGYPNAGPSLQETCHDLHVAFLAIASANQSAPNIRRARRLDQLAIYGCRINPRESIGRLEIALHLVTPL
jgi:hypothetical protein